MSKNLIGRWFLGTLESLARSHGARALARVHYASRQTPATEHFLKGANSLRTIPLHFVDEDTVNAIETTAKNQARAAALAGSLGLRTSVVADHLDAIEKHKWVMGETLGRDVGAKVAALDYFENFNREGKESVKGWVERLCQGLLRNLDNDGPRSIAAFEHAMRGTQSLAH